MQRADLMVAGTKIQAETGKNPQKNRLFLPKQYMQGGNKAIVSTD